MIICYNVLHKTSSFILVEVAVSFMKINNDNMHDIEKIIDVVLSFGSETQYSRLLDIILTKMLEITNSDAGTLYILEDKQLHFGIIKNSSLNIYQSSGLVCIDAQGSGTINFPPISLDTKSIDNISAYAAVNNEIVAIDDVYTNQRFNFSGPKNYDKMTGYRTQSMLALPLSVSMDNQEHVLGVIQLINAKDPDTGKVVPYHNIDNPPIIPSLSKIASNTLGNLLHMQEIRELFRSFIAMLTKAIDERSAYNNLHTQQVAWYCNSFAKYLSSKFEPDSPYYFDENRIERITIAALLHDIGKIVTPLDIMDKSDRLGGRRQGLFYRFEIKRLQLENDMLKGLISSETCARETARIDNAAALAKTLNTLNILDDEHISQVTELGKLTYRNELGETAPILDFEDINMLSTRRGTLTEEERAVMQGHVISTGKLLDQISSWKYYGDIPEWTRNHHEYLDGSGYPRGLKAGEIGIETCIITIADIFEALIANDRPYKQAVPVDKAITILTDMADKGKLNKELVALFTESKLWLECPKELGSQ